MSWVSNDKDELERGSGTEKVVLLERQNVEGSRSGENKLYEPGKHFDGGNGIYRWGLRSTKTK